MAVRIRAHDWASTPLGPAERWPQSLRTAVDMILAMPGPATLLWGPRHVQIYNDAYIPIARDRHPALLGRPVAEGWPDAYDAVIAPLLEAAQAGRATRLTGFLVPLAGLDGRLEERVFDTDWSPVRDESGVPAGALQTLVEATDRHEAQAVLRESQARQAFLLRLTDALRAEQDQDAVVDRAVRMLGEELALDRCYAAAMFPAEDRVEVTHEVRRPDLPAMPSPLRFSDFPEARRQSFDRTLVFDDTVNDPELTDADKRALAAMSFGALLSRPLRLGAGDPIWGLGAVSSRPRRWTQGEIALVEEVTERTWAAAERAGAEAALRESEDVRRIALESGGMGAWRWDARSGSVRADEAFHRLWGLSFADQPHPVSTYTGRMDPDGAAALEAVMAEDIAPGEQFQDEVQVTSGPTAGRWIQWRGRAEHDRSWIINGVSFDVTEQRLAEQRLRESEVKLREAEASHRSELERQVRARTAELASSRDLLQATMDASTDMIQVFEAIRDEAGEIVDFRWVLNNHTSESRYGRIEGESLLERNPGVRVEGIFDAFKRVTETGVPEQAERYYAHEQFAGWFYQSVVKLGDGVATTTKDITAWRAAQEEVLRLQAEVAQARLDESEARFRGLVQGMAQAVWETDADGAVVADSPSWRAYTGQTLDESLGYGWLDAIHPDDRGYAERQWREAVGAARNLDAEFRLRRAGGGWRWTNVRAVPLRAGDGTIRRWAGINFDISERKETEDALRESEARLRDVLKIQTVGVMFWGENLDLTDVNEAFLRMTGFTREEALGRTWAELTPPEFHEASREAVDEVLTRGESTPYEKQYLRKDGSRWWGLFAARRIGDEVVEFVLDVTERREAEAARRASEERFRLLVESVRDYAIFTTDRDGIITSWPGGAAAVYGWSEAEIMGQSVDLTFVPEDVAAGAPEKERETAVREGLAPIVREHLCRGGSRIVINGSTQLLAGADGRIREFIKVGQDVTEARRVQQALAESEGRLRTLMEGVPQLVWRSCGQGLWTWSSPQWQAFTGQSLEASQGRGWLDAVHADDHAATMRAWEAARPHGMLDVEFRVRRASDGEYLWHHTRSLPVRNGDGRIVEWLGTTTDVQQLKELQEHQAVMVAELQHRTRNLIAVVRSIAGQTMAQTGPTEAFRDEFNHRLGALARVQGLLSRSEEEPITMEALIRMELDALAGLDGARERIQLDGPPVRIRHSVVQTLALALHELATNARKYGALSNSDGRLAVAWRTYEDGNRERLALEWTEHGGRPPNIDGDARRGYGRELIERALPYSLNAKTSFEHDETGLRCTIDMPLERTRGRRRAA